MSAANATDRSPGRPVVPAAALGAVHAVLVTVVWDAFGRQGPGTIPHVYAWVALGGVAVGATAAYLALDRGLRSPPVAVALAFVATVVPTWRHHATLDAATATHPQPLWLYAVLWPAVLVCAVALAGLESLVRRAAGSGNA